LDLDFFDSSTKAEENIKTEEKKQAEAEVKEIPNNKEDKKEEIKVNEIDGSVIKLEGEKMCLTFLFIKFFFQRCFSY